MFEPQTALNRTDELNRCRDRSWLSMDDQKRFGVTNPVTVGDYEGLDWTEPEPSYTHFVGLISIGQKVFLSDEQFIGLITKMFQNPIGQVSHLAVRAARLFGRHKMVPVASINEVTSLRVNLSIDRDQFNDLPEYKADSTLAEELDRVLWKDVVLRETDYYQIDGQVRDGIITLNGHVITSMNQWRAETAVKSIPGILGLKSYIIPDDKLTLIVAEALGKFEQRDDCKFFSRVENGLAVLIGEVSSAALRNEAEQCVANIPWVRGVMSEISVTGVVVDSIDQRFLQPLIGHDLIFKDALSVTIRKVIINPHNRLVIGVVVMGQFPALLRKEPNSDYRDENGPARLVELPIELILHLTRSTGFIRISSQETALYKDFDPSSYITPNQDWLPPYPYCTNEVLFPVE